MAPYGAAFDQVAVNVAIGVAVGALTSGVAGAVPGPSASPIWGIVIGSASAAATTAISDVVGGRSVGWDVLASAAISAAQGAATFGLQKVAALSQASGRNPADAEFELGVRAQRSQQRAVEQASEFADVWIEGPSGGEPQGHLSIAIGDPNGQYVSLRLARTRPAPMLRRSAYTGAFMKMKR